VITPVPPTPGDDDAPRRFSHGSDGFGQQLCIVNGFGPFAFAFLALLQLPPSNLL